MTHIGFLSLKSGEKQHWILIWVLKDGRQEEMPFRQKAGPTDGWVPYWLSGQEKRWEESNSAWA